jgi:hypothetical protein
MIFITVLIPDGLIQVSLCLFLKDLIYKILVSTSCIDTTPFDSDLAIKILYARFISSAFFLPQLSNAMLFDESNSILWSVQIMDVKTI